MSAMLTNFAWLFRLPAIKVEGGGRTYLTEILVEDPFSARRGKFRSRLSRRQFSQFKFHFSECFEISMIGMFLHRSIFKRYSCCIILVMISQMFDEISARSKISSNFAKICFIESSRKFTGIAGNAR